jgi:prepilin peptidase CpaA
MWSEYLIPVPWIAVIGAALVAAAWDMRTRKIPNRLTMPLLAAGLLWGLLTAGWAGLGGAAAGCFLAALPFVILFVFAGGGAGDAKVMGALGAWVGVTGSLVLVASVAITGGVLAILFAAAKKDLKSVLTNVALMAWSLMFVLLGRLPVGAVDNAAPPRMESMKAMPYGVAIFLGSCVACGGVLLWQG